MIKTHLGKDMEIMQVRLVHIDLMIAGDEAEGEFVEGSARRQGEKGLGLS